VRRFSTITFGSKQVQWDNGELGGASSLKEQHLVVLPNVQQLSQVLLSLAGVILAMKKKKKKNF